MNYINNNGILMLVIGIVFNIATLFQPKKTMDKNYENVVYKSIKYLKRKVLDEFSIKRFVLGITLIGVGSLFAISLGGGTISEDKMSILLNFFLSFIFAWILTEYSAEKGFNERQKEAAIRSYRHSINIRNKLDYTIKIIEHLYLQLSKYKCINGSVNKCELVFNLESVKNYLVLAQRDALNNIYDWADIISDELNINKQILDNEEDIKKVRRKIQESGQLPEHDINTTHRQEIAKIKSKIQDLKESLSSRIRYTLENEEEFKNEYTDQLVSEIEGMKTERLNKEKVKPKSENLKPRNGNEDTKNPKTGTEDLK